MKVRFWGTRGSLPRPTTGSEVRTKIAKALEMAQGHVLPDARARDRFIDTALPFASRAGFGGNTSCVQIEGSEEHILCDAGTGLRDFGKDLMKRGKIGPSRFHIFLSHLHWDHIQGFPFFAPAYVPGTSIDIYGCHPGMDEAFRLQQAPPFFPLPLSELRSTIRFHTLSAEGEYDIAGFRIKVIEQDHPGKSFGYSFTGCGRKIVYSTDSEHRVNPESSPFVEFFRTADLLIFDAQYSLAEAELNKRDWGHSSNMMGVELAALAGVKHLVLFHTEPNLDDFRLEELKEKSASYSRIYAGDRPLAVSVAYDGMEVDLSSV
jgi:phosphoribosyl 1,2-cyclic phosphodiesterase